MNSRGPSLAAFCALLAGFSPLTANHARAAEDPFAENIRKTEPLTPEQERQTFHLPPGFEIELFASEPEIGKPMNLAFDVQGRLWFTESREYPYAAPLDKPGRDKIKILEDRHHTGHADQVTTFVDGLNIPIGLYPFKNGAVAWSIPNIWHFDDPRRAGKADVREKLYGPLGFERDTHGMNSSFRRGYDGWLYCTHGFNNNTTLRGADGSEIKMNSGNTYRVRLDGSHVEQNTWGQVNPFGLFFDSYGNLFSADCHSQPLYELLRGGYYPSFGKPHDGLGYAPEMIFHDHGSTAICGIVYYSDNQWPEEYRDNIFTGNVMTCRINRDALTFAGSTPTANHQPDFLSSDDPWFRPVDLQLGPDGALYVADFYNRIIGHYEVALNHPGRDHERGRIWRIVYRGPKPAVSVASGVTEKPTAWLRPLLSQKNLEVRQRIEELNSPNLTVRMLAMNQLVDVLGKAAIHRVQRMMRDARASATQKMHGLWVLHRLNALDEKILTTAASDKDYGVRTHAMRVLAEIPAWNARQEALALAGLTDPQALVQRAAADALGQHAALVHVAPLLQLRQQVPKADTHLLHVVRMALRNQLLLDGVLPHLELSRLSEAEARSIADVAVGAAKPEAGAWLLRYVQKYDEDRETLTRYLKHAVRYAPPGQTRELAGFIRRKFAEDLDLQLSLLKSMREGAAQRGGAADADLRSWAEELAGRLLASLDEESHAWFNTPVEGMAKQTNPWFLQRRKSKDGDTNSIFFCSLPPGGESLTGILRSKSFVLPARLSFYLAGHNGFPGQPDQKKNVVRLREAETQAVLAESFPPRNDTAMSYTWDLSAQAGHRGYLEITDADSGSAYAWLAAGRFEPPVVAMPKLNPSQVDAREQAVAGLAQSLSLTELTPQLEQMLANDGVNLSVRAAAAQTLLAFQPDEQLSPLVSLLNDSGTTFELRQKIARSLAERARGNSRATLVEVLHSAPYRGQVKLAQALAGTTAGSATLLELIEHGQASAQLLLDRIVKDKLSAAAVPDAASRLAKLTRGLTPVNETVQKLIDQRRAAYVPEKASAADGKKVFMQTCAVCHRIGVSGELVGPQLDGVGNRGLDRIIEDVLDPSRNVDKAFRTHIILLKDGDVVSGLPRREEGELLVLADSTGKEVSIPKKDIKERRESESSLMPDNFGDVISLADFNNLMAFLLSQTGRK